MRILESFSGKRCMAFKEVKYQSQEMQFQSLGQKGILEKKMATHCSILAWRTPWTEESCVLQSMGSQRVGHDRVTFTSLF